MQSPDIHVLNSMRRADVKILTISLFSSCDLFKDTSLSVLLENCPGYKILGDYNYAMEPFPED